tara:strand:- start:607 stop:777 length:171 start_codon:yes stop_codon:yes gene_type:complete
MDTTPPIIENVKIIKTIAVIPFNNNLLINDKKLSALDKSDLGLLIGFSKRNMMISY